MWKNFRNHIGSNDLWLFLLFILQLIYLVLSILLPVEANSDKTSIDIVNRTATAVLVGYFISKNFISEKPKHILDEPEKTRLHFQTSVVALIGLFSLCIMIVVRYIEIISISHAILSQIRDLYLASVAFLMGTSK